MNVPIVVDLPDKLYREYAMISERTATPIKHLIVGAAVKAVSKPGMSKRSPHTAARILALQAKGKTAREISELIGISVQGVSYHLMRAGVKTATPARKYDHDLLRRLWMAGATYAEISKQVGCAQSSVSALRKKLGLPDRPAPTHRKEPTP